MICQGCGKQEATVHYTKILNEARVDFYFCQECAKANEHFSLIYDHAELSLQQLLSGLFDEIKPGPSTSNTQTSVHNHLNCQCGWTYKNLVKTGTFGCPTCYETFHEPLQNICKKLHSGNQKHIGKIPVRCGSAIEKRKTLLELKAKLNQLILEENFEEAATIRDEIKKINSDSSSSE